MTGFRWFSNIFAFWCFGRTKPWHWKGQVSLSLDKYKFFSSSKLSRGMDRADTGLISRYGLAQTCGRLHHPLRWGCPVWCSLRWRKEWICSERPITKCAIVKGWTHARSDRSGIRTRSRGNKDQSGLSYHLHYRDTWHLIYPISWACAEHQFFRLFSWHWLRPACSVDRLASNPPVFEHLRCYGQVTKVFFNLIDLAKGRDGGVKFKSVC